MSSALAEPGYRTLPLRVRARWRRDAVARGLAGAAAVLAGGAAALLLLDGAVGLEPGWRSGLRWLPLLAAALPVTTAWRRSRALTDDRRAALLVEERQPEVEHLLTTALEVEPSTAVGEALRRRAGARLAGVRAERIVPYTFASASAWAVAALLLAGALVIFAPGGPAAVWGRWAHPEAALRADGGSAARGAGSGSAPAAALPPALTAVEVMVAPPAYTGRPARQVPGEGLVSALPGSRITVRVAATGGVLSAGVAGGGPLATLATPEGWAVSWVLEADHRGVDLTLAADSTAGVEAGGGGAVADRRVIPIAVTEDRPPEITLELPAEDLVVGGAAGVVRIRARAVDDFGTADFDLLWVRSSGSGESFSFDEGRWSWDAVATRGDTLVGDLALDLATTGMGPGDVLHVRAEGRDRNEVTGPGLGVSTTRQIRVAEPDALDEVTTLVGFPIEREREPILSQRMIILLTEELLEQADTLTADAFRARSSAIADEQDRLRKRVEESIFERAAEAQEDPEAAAGAVPDPNPEPGAPLEPPGHDHDGNPILAVDQNLLEAFNAMWEASRFLRQAEPAPSLPPQRRALDRLQRLREADRVYARGRVTRPPLDLDAARGTGEVDEADPATRVPGEAAPDGARWRSEIEAAAEALGSGDERPLALRLQGLAAAVLSADDGSVEAAAAIERAGRTVAAGELGAARALLAEAAAALSTQAVPGAAPPVSAPLDARGATYLARLADASAGDAAADAGAVPAPAEASAGSTAPFVFATVRYASGDWDSAPLVPSNLLHSLAQYTDLPVADEGVIVDLAIPDLLRYPFAFMTGHLPVRLDEAEAQGLRRYVERGGFLFIDDHNHDIDGAFHRSVLAELARIFGPDALRPLPAEHELYRSFFVFDDGPPITGHELSGWGDGLIHRELFAVTVGGRIGILYSNKDYASEWSYHAENKRFLAQDNTRFGVNVILYALTR